MVNSIQDPNPTPNFMATNDPLLLSTLIKSMGEMDLHAETDCFTAWLAKKAHQTASTNYTSNKLASPSINFQSKTTPAHYHHASHQHQYMKQFHHPIESIEQLENMSSDEIDALLQKLLKNKTAFEKWQDQKGIQEREKRENEVKRAELRMKNAELMLKKQLARREKAIKAWEEEKRNSSIKETDSRVEKKMMNQKLHCERQEKSKKAYQEWLKEKEKQHHQLIEPSLQKKTKATRPMWVTIELPSQKSESFHDEKRNARQTSSMILSPPNLYNDYNMYKKYAPEYFKKYKLLVASGGVELTNEKMAKNPNPNPKKPKINK